MNHHTHSGYGQSDQAEPVAEFYEAVPGTRYGHDPYMGPAKLTDARPWADEAACRNVPHIFEKADGVKKRAVTTVDSRTGNRINRALGPVEKAKAVCAGCPAQALCLAEAMAEESGSHHHRFSVRGGLTARERADLWMSQQE